MQNDEKIRGSEELHEEHEESPGDSEHQDGAPASIGELIRSRAGVVLEAMALLLIVLLTFRGRPWAPQAAALSAYTLLFFGMTFRSNQFPLGRSENRDALPQCALIHSLFLVLIYGLVRYAMEVIPNLHNVPQSYGKGIWGDSGSGPGFVPYLVLVLGILAILWLQLRWVWGILDRLNEK